MKNYKNKQALCVVEGDDIMCVTSKHTMSHNVISDWDTPVATINVSILDTLISFIPTSCFSDIRLELINGMRDCGNMKDMEEFLEKSFEFRKVIEAVQNITLDKEACEEADLSSSSVGKIDLENLTPYMNAGTDPDMN